MKLLEWVVLELLIALISSLPTTPNIKILYRVQQEAVVLSNYDWSRLLGLFLKMMELPHWTDIAKTGKLKELAPYDSDWTLQTAVGVFGGGDDSNGKDATHLMVADARNSGHPAISRGRKITSSGFPSTNILNQLGFVSSPNNSTTSTISSSSPRLGLNLQAMDFLGNNSSLGSLKVDLCHRMMLLEKRLLARLQERSCLTRYALCTRSVSKVPPVCYAHLAAFRARFYIQEETNAEDNVDADADAEANFQPLREITGNVKDYMYFC